MGTMKVWDGTAWQTVTGQGAPGVGIPSGGTIGQRLIKASAASFDAVWDGDNDYANWTAYTPRFATDAGNEAGMTPGSGGFIQGLYRMIAPYTMALFTRFQWGTSGGNGGTGNHLYSLPAGYVTTAGYYQYAQCFVYRPAGQTYLGLVHVFNNDIWLRPCSPNAALIQDVVGMQQQLITSGANPHPPNWYPNGSCGCWGVLNVQQRW